MASKKNSEARPQISEVSPSAAIAGGELRIRGTGFVRSERPRVKLGDVVAPLAIGSDSLVVVRVPDTATVGDLSLSNGDEESAPWACDIGISIADSLHPVANPAVDPQGNIFATFSGARGQKTPVSVYQIDLHYQVKPFLTDLMNPTGLAFDRQGLLYISSRFNGIVYQATPSGQMSVYVEGMGVATGLAFDQAGDLYVGDRAGTIFKVGQDRQIFVFATLEPSIAAYHLAFAPDGYLYVTGPTTSSFDSVYRISTAGDVEVFYRGLGRPQGMAFDAEGRLYVAGSIGGRKGIVRFGENREPELCVAGPNIVGLAFTPSRSMVVATNSALFRIDMDVQGRTLPSSNS
jgi:sugar lactone lactonase YvrE